MYSIDELNAKSRDELRAVAKEMEIVGRGKMNKAELAQAIFDNQPFEEEQKPEPVVEQESEKVSDDVVEENDVKVEEEPAKQKQGDFSKFREENHMKIVEACEVGDFVAFNCGGTKVRSAKVTRKSSKRRKLKVETAYGRKFIIDFDAVIWVKKSAEAKWPHGVYKALKGIE